MGIGFFFVGPAKHRALPPSPVAKTSCMQRLMGRLLRATPTSLHAWALAAGGFPYRSLGLGLNCFFCFSLYSK